jgi:hypothetical protein
MEEFNWANNNVINAKIAQQDKFLLETSAKTELCVLVINNSIMPQTHASTAQQVNWEMPQLEDVNPLLLTAMPVEESN